MHSDANAVRLAGDLGASAFTVGAQIAFAAGEYQPGTPSGEALLAHEFAHVAQQRSAPAGGRLLKRGSLEQTALEDNADQAAIGALARLYRAGSLAAEKLNVRPRLCAGLTLQRCRDKKEQAPEPPSNPPARKADSKELTRGTMTWNLEPYQSASAQMQNSFKPKPGLIRRSPFSRPCSTPGSEIRPSRKLQLTSHRLFEGRVRPLMAPSGTAPTKWIEEGLDKELVEKSTT